MDGDGEINNDGLINSGSDCYVERIALAVNNYDRYLIWDSTTNNYKIDDDIDDDGIEDYEDKDMDADGMPDVYEAKYGDLDITLYDEDGEYGENQVNGEGWQNPLIYNARYALLIGGGGTNEGDKDNNLPAFKNDLKAMYDQLRGYNYLHENIYSFLWNKKSIDNYYIDGPALMWRSFDESLKFDSEIIIEDGMRKIGNRITKNDFFFFMELAHGSYFDEPNTIDANIQLLRVNKYSEYLTMNILISELNNEFVIYKNHNYARGVFIHSSCHASRGISYLAGENRIIISAENWLEDTDPGNVFCKFHSPLESRNEHAAFLYEGKKLLGLGFFPDESLYPGFIKSMGKINEAENILHMYHQGYEAATNNYWGERWPFEDIYKTSHATLEDNNDADWDSSYGGYLYGRTWNNLESDYQTDPSDDGYLSYHTYL